MDGFRIAGGSIPGWEHTEPGKPVWRNNQDAYGWTREEGSLAAVVCDGCSAGGGNEVGAHIGVRLASASLMQLLRCGFKPSKETAPLMLSYLKRSMLGPLRVLTDAMTTTDTNRVIAEHFLFTTVGVLMSSETTIIFALGDGVFAINGEVTVMRAREANKPPYLAYHLVPSTFDASDLEFVALKILLTRDVESLAIGSDGLVDFIAACDQPLPVIGGAVGAFSQFWEDPSYTLHEDKIRRRLAMANREWAEGNRIHHGLLPDDTTLVVVRREPS
jgi:hypothetical protein